MASEDLFENYSEEIVTEPQQEIVNNIEEEQILDEETEDMTAGLVLDEESHEIINAPKENEETAQLSKPTQATERETRLFQLPLARIRNLMKLDPDLHLASHEATFLVTRATELFIESLAKESYIYTAQAKKKTVQKRDVDMAIAAVDSLMFLDGAMNF